MAPVATSRGIVGVLRVTPFVFFPHKGPGLVGLNLLGLEAANPVVVEVFGVLAEPLGEAQDGVEADLAKPRRGAATTVIGEVLRDGDEGGLRGAQAKQRRVGYRRSRGQQTSQASRHARYMTFQLAEVAVPRQLFAQILEWIDRFCPACASG
jgi:hypothetical protein